MKGCESRSVNLLPFRICKTALHRSASPPATQIVLPVPPRCPRLSGLTKGIKFSDTHIWRRVAQAVILIVNNDTESCDGDPQVHTDYRTD